MEDLIENDIVKIFLSNGIIFAAYQPNFVMDIIAAKKTVEYRKVISKGNSYPLLADIRNLKAATDEARDWLGSAPESHEYLLATAVLTNNPIQNLLANFYLKFSKPLSPTQLFTNQEKAIRWLKLFAQQN